MFVFVCFFAYFIYIQSVSLYILYYIRAPLLSQLALMCLTFLSTSDYSYKYPGLVSGQLMKSIWIWFAFCLFCIYLWIKAPSHEVQVIHIYLSQGKCIYIEIFFFLHCIFSLHIVQTYLQIISELKTQIAIMACQEINLQDNYNSSR